MCVSLSKPSPAGERFLKSEVGDGVKLGGRHPPTCPPSLITSVTTHPLSRAAAPVRTPAGSSFCFIVFNSHTHPVGRSLFLPMGDRRQAFAEANAEC